MLTKRIMRIETFEVSLRWNCLLQCIVKQLKIQYSMAWISMRWTTSTIYILPSPHVSFKYCIHTFWQLYIWVHYISWWWRLQLLKRGWHLIWFSCALCLWQSHFSLARGLIVQSIFLYILGATGCTIKINERN